jgi:hypothetical protein
MGPDVRAAACIIAVVEGLNLLEMRRQTGKAGLSENPKLRFLERQS